MGSEFNCPTSLSVSKRKFIVCLVSNRSPLIILVTKQIQERYLVNGWTPIMFCHIHPRVYHTCLLYLYSIYSVNSSAHTRWHTHKHTNTPTHAHCPYTYSFFFLSLSLSFPWRNFFTYLGPYCLSLCFRIVQYYSVTDRSCTLQK